MLSMPLLSLKHNCPWRLGGQVQKGLCQESLTWLERTFDSKVTHAQVLSQETSLVPRSVLET